MKVWVFMCNKELDIKMAECSICRSIAPVYGDEHGVKRTGETIERGEVGYNFLAHASGHQVTSDFCDGCLEDKFKQDFLGRATLEVGRRIELGCKNCEEVGPMRYEGRSFNERDKDSLPEKYAQYKDHHSYSCPSCKTTLAYSPDEIVQSLIDIQKGKGELVGLFE